MYCNTNECFYKINKKSRCLSLQNHLGGAKGWGGITCIHDLAVSLITCRNISSMLESSVIYLPHSCMQKASNLRLPTEATLFFHNKKWQYTGVQRSMKLVKCLYSFKNYAHGLMLYCKQIRVTNLQIFRADTQNGWLCWLIVYAPPPLSKILDPPLNRDIHQIISITES